MTTDNSGTLPPEPEVTSRSGISMVWVIPILTLIVGGWLIYKTLSEQGPRIEITFKAATGIEAGKTRIKYKDIDIGKVDDVRFSEDFSKVVLEVSMNSGTEHFLGRGAKFWVVKPRLSLKGASGLETLVSGAYIEVEPGMGEVQDRFEGLEVPPVVKADVPGTKFLLVTHTLNSIDTGSPIYFQGILAGEVQGWELGNDRKSIFVHTFIKAPYDRLIKGNTRFWNISGVDLSMDASGIQLRTRSLTSLIYGGIAFETPETPKTIKEETLSDVSGLVFTLYDDYRAIEAAEYIRKLTCVLFFDSSVRGLSQGAPVEFKGIRVGQVKELRLAYDRKSQTFKIPVLVEIEPERFLTDAQMAKITPLETLENMIQDGLRARLETGSLLTGQLFIALDMHPEAPLNLVGAEVPFPELPTIPADLTEMTESVKVILNKLEHLDIKRIEDELVATLEGAGNIVSQAGRALERADIETAVADFSQALAMLRKVLSRVDHHMTPMADSLEATLVSGRDTLEKLRNSLDMVDKNLDPNAPLQYHLIELTGEFTEMARSIRILVDMLERNPNSVIFGKLPPVHTPETSSGD
ncbi:MAG: MlaD family protein [Desulfobacterales bacterium]|nr:MlaD family protein [Desulfobacterales bacterium]